MGEVHSDQNKYQCASRSLGIRVMPSATISAVLILKLPLSLIYSYFLHQCGSLTGPCGKGYIFCEEETGPVARVKTSSTCLACLAEALLP